MSFAHVARAAAVVCLLAPLAVPGQSAEQKGKKYALVVGVNDYGHRALTSLRYAENDAEQLALALRQGGFDGVTVLTGSRGKKDAKAAATADNVRAELARLLRGKTKHDLILVALSGHGVQLEVDDPDGKGEPRVYSYFCPGDADLLGASYSNGRAKSLILLDDLFAELGRCGAGTRLVLVDACRNELKARGATRAIDSGQITIPEGVAALFSCARGQKAWEAEKLEHGVFFHFVLRGLKGKAVDDDGAVTWDRLGEYVKGRVSAEVGDLVGGGAKQKPHGVGNLVGASPVLLRRALINSIGMKLALVPAGRFRMGSPQREKDRDRDEQPHDVEITEAFYLGVYEVTQKQYRAVTGKNPSHFRKGGKGEDRLTDDDTDDLPVENMSWADAVEFCKKLSALPEEKKAGRTYRLPTEAEWEYACRAGTSAAFQTGENLTAKQANFDRALDRPLKVGSYRPNAWGLYDMHGNVSEWCSDRYSASAYGRELRRDPQGSDEGDLRVVRGGGWLGGRRSCRCAARGTARPAAAASHVGFRVVCVPAGRR